MADGDTQPIVPRDVVQRARVDIGAGRLWKARDRLNGALVHRADEELLNLLGQVQFAMGDLPAAGGLWFLTGWDGPDAEAADLAWRERHGADPLQLWLSLPPLARRTVDHPAAKELRSAARDRAKTVRRATPVRLPAEVRPSLRRTSVTGTLAFAAIVGLVAVILIVGLVTVARWVLPGT